MNASSTTLGSGFFAESTETALPFSHHSRVDFQFDHSVALSHRASAVRSGGLVGMGLPANFELNLGFSFGLLTGDVSMDAPLNATDDSQPLSGLWAGDVRSSLLWTAKDISNAGVGFLLGVHVFWPTGANARLAGEGGVSAEPFVSSGVEMFGLRLLLNAGFRFRPQHASNYGEDRFVQHHDFIWKAALRLPREEDIAWSVEVQGALGLVDTPPGMRSSSTRPLWMGAGFDFPISIRDRFGIMAGVGVLGETTPVFSVSVRLFRGESRSDIDGDGIPDFKDACPYLPEDYDGFEDEDGCPDLDNDRDGFPDVEDQCPLVFADEFSDDGCP